jgi:hypothetical protein
MSFLNFEFLKTWTQFLRKRISNIHPTLVHTHGHITNASDKTLHTKT